MRSILYFVLIMVIYAAKTASAIKCYNCDSLSDPRCGPSFCPFNIEEADCDDLDMPKYLQNLGIRVPAAGCITKVHQGVEGQRYFIRRTCFYGNLDYTEAACQAPDPHVFHAKLITCDVCADDLCNTSMNAAGKLMQINSGILLLLGIAQLLSRVF